MVQNLLEYCQPTNLSDLFPPWHPAFYGMNPSLFTSFRLTVRFSFDYQGRVVRLDTFSKVRHGFYMSILPSGWTSIWQTIAPGSRLGWFTCNPLFAERLERQGETSFQAPCGFGQVFVMVSRRVFVVDIQFTGHYNKDIDALDLRWLHPLAQGCVTVFTCSSHQWRGPHQVCEQSISNAAISLLIASQRSSIYMWFLQLQASGKAALSTRHHPKSRRAPVWRRNIRPGIARCLASFPQSRECSYG
jgi:hypothetical protein